MRYYEDDRRERVPLLISLMPLSVLIKICDFEWKIEKFMWKFRKKMNHIPEISSFILTYIRMNKNNRNTKGKR